MSCEICMIISIQSFLWVNVISVNRLQNPEDASMYFDATAAIPLQTNVLDNDSSSSHPLGETPQMPGLGPDVLNGGGGVLARSVTAPQLTSEPNRLNVDPSADEDSSTNLSQNNNNNNSSNQSTIGCTPGLRRRRQAEKYATDSTQLGLRFQRRRRHNAGSCPDEDESGATGCAPLIYRDESPLPAPPEYE